MRWRNAFRPGIRYEAFNQLLNSCGTPAPLLMPNIIYALGIYHAYSALGLICTEAGLARAHSVLGMPYVLIKVGAALSNRGIQLALAAPTRWAAPVRDFR